MLKERECDADTLMVENQESSSNGVELNVEDVEYAAISGTAIGSLEGMLSAFLSLSRTTRKWAKSNKFGQRDIFC